VVAPVTGGPSPRGVTAVFRSELLKLRTVATTTWLPVTAVVRGSRRAARADITGAV
jgi:hypothetical protein